MIYFALTITAIELNEQLKIVTACTHIVNTNNTKEDEDFFNLVRGKTIKTSKTLNKVKLV